jgi:hypothetical protein
MSIRAMPAFAHHNKGRPKKRMSIAGHDFAGRWIFNFKAVLKATLFLEEL